jgi:hypothetical protein
MAGVVHLAARLHLLSALLSLTIAVTPCIKARLYLYTTSSCWWLRQTVKIVWNGGRVEMSGYGRHVVLAFAE